MATARRPILPPPPEIPESPGIIAPPSALPQWDRRLRVLRFDGSVVKRFQVPAENQELVLSAFQEEGWPNAIDDPLPPADGIAMKERLKFTIRRLNAAQTERRMHFFGDGTGEAVCWEPSAAAVRVRHPG